ncbi:MAG: hypothetical protein CM15mV136_270 [Caudoviricetes sp.]|nr:MAG: hypothetical protein CM15mV136_270 [Caudoviricetes sp.]
MKRRNLTGIPGLSWLIFTHFMELNLYDDIAMRSKKRQ